jgi:hypothetical protein
LEKEYNSQQKERRALSPKELKEEEKRYGLAQGEDEDGTPDIKSVKERLLAIQQEAKHEKRQKAKLTQGLGESKRQRPNKRQRRSKEIKG